MNVQLGWKWGSDVGTKRLLDVEKLLHWAFRDELPKDVKRESYGGGMSPMFALADLGTRVDVWAEEPGFPRALGEPHPDALLVEQAVLALEDAAIDWPATRRTLVGSLGGLLSDNEPGLTHLTIGVVGLVALHARMGTRPRWDMWPEPEPVIGRNGKPVVQYIDKDGRLVEGRRNGHYGEEARCPLLWFPAPREAAFVRIEYSIWWQAIDTLADYLADRLSDHAALAPAAHPSPWCSER